MIPTSLMQKQLTRERIVTDTSGRAGQRTFLSFNAYWEPKRVLVRAGNGETVYSRALIIAQPQTDIENGDWVHEGIFSLTDPPKARGFEVGAVFRPTVPQTGRAHQVEVTLI